MKRARIRVPYVCSDVADVWGRHTAGCVGIALVRMVSRLWSRGLLVLLRVSSLSPPSPCALVVARWQPPRPSSDLTAWLWFTGGCHLLQPPCPWQKVGCGAIAPHKFVLRASINLGGMRYGPAQIGPRIRNEGRAPPRLPECRRRCLDTCRLPLGHLACTIFGHGHCIGPCMTPSHA